MLHRNSPAHGRALRRIIEYIERGREKYSLRKLASEGARVTSGYSYLPKYTFACTGRNLRCASKVFFCQWEFICRSFDVSHVYIIFKNGLLELVFNS